MSKVTDLDVINIDVSTINSWIDQQNWSTETKLLAKSRAEYLSAHKMNPYTHTEWIDFVDYELEVRRVFSSL